MTLSQFEFSPADISSALKAQTPAVRRRGSRVGEKQILAIRREINQTPDSPAELTGHGA